MNICVMLWATLSFIFIILEIGHPSLIMYLPSSIAALCAAIAAYYNCLFINQMSMFFLSSVLALWLFKKNLKKMHGSYHRTNVDALIGKNAVVIAAISCNTPGYVKVEGQLWLARSAFSLPLASKVRIIGVRGAHVMVEPDN